MRLLFAHPQLFSFPGNARGAFKSFKALVSALAQRGHECELVTARGGSTAEIAAWRELCTPEGTGAPATVRVSSLGDTRSGHGTRRSLREELRFLRFLAVRERAFEPDWILCENGTLELRAASLLFPGRLVVGISTTASLPFGPHRASRYASLSARWVYSRIPKIHCISRFVKDYVERHVAREAAVQHQLSYGKPPFEAAGRYSGGAITMVNPAAHKGGELFAELARRFSDERFRAVESYATIVPELRRLSNVEIVPAEEDVGRVLSGSKLVVVPSMWGEAWGMICVDAMLRGIPVLASNDGGLPESTLGVGRCIPVVPGRLRQRRSGDVRFRQAPVDIEPWCREISGLIGNQAVWNERSQASSAAARSYVEGLSIQPLCDYLAS